MSQSKTGVATFGALSLLAGAAVGAASAWVGFSTGSREKGLLSALGYVFGALGALSAVGGTVGAVLWVAGVSLIPEEELTAASNTSSSIG